MPEFADPDRRVLVSVDMESYSGRDNVLQYRAQLAFQKIMKEACERLGFDRVNWRIQQGGDGELAILPAGASERAVVAELTPVIDRLLREHNRGLAREAQVRLRIGVHEGLVHLDGANGYPGEAVVTVCRLIDSPQLKATLRRLPGAAVALIVSDRVYQDVVRHYQDLRPEHFQPVSVELPEKNFRADAWVYVPGENVTEVVERVSRTDVPRAGSRKGEGGDASDGDSCGLGPQPGTGGQSFSNITSHGISAYGNGNVISAPGTTDAVDPWRMTS